MLITQKFKNTCWRATGRGDYVDGAFERWRIFFMLDQKHTNLEFEDFNPKRFFPFYRQFLTGKYLENN